MVLDIIICIFNKLASLLREGGPARDQYAKAILRCVLVSSVAIIVRFFRRNSLFIRGLLSTLDISYCIVLSQNITYRLMYEFFDKKIISMVDAFYSDKINISHLQLSTPNIHKRYMSN